MENEPVRVEEKLKRCLEEDKIINNLYFGHGFLLSAMNPTAVIGLRLTTYMRPAIDSGSHAFTNSSEV